MEGTTGAAVADAPATSAPAVSTPSPSPAPAPSVPKADTPSSFAEALTAKLAAPATADPGVPPPASVQPPAASVPAPAETTTPAPAAPTPEPKGPIPYERHESILKNARTKTAEETAQKFQQQYAPFVELGTRIEADPVGTVVGLIQSLAATPEHGQAVISALARTLGSRRSQATQSAEEAEPQADLVSVDRETGEKTFVYSDKQLAKREAWHQRRMLAEIDQRLQPLQAREQQRVASERMTQAQAEANQRMAKTLEPYKAMLPDFETHKPALREKAQAYLAEGHNAETALGLAVLSILNERVVPARTAQSQQQLVTQAIAKATGSTSAPGTAPAAPATRPTSFEDAFRRIAV